VRGDAERVQQLFKRIGIKSEDTTIKFDIKHIDLETLVTELRLKYLAAHKDNVNTLFFIWYGGHGVLHYYSQMVLNEKDPGNRYFPLELYLNEYSKFKNTYTFVCQDSCRSRLLDEDLDAIRGKGDVVCTK